MEIDFNKYAKKSIAVLVSRILDESIIDKSITYMDLAKLIKFPEPYTGNYFQSNMGKVLGEVCVLLQDANIPKTLKPVPIIQTLVISKTTGLPSDGIKISVIGYENFSKNIKKNFVMAEHEKIKLYGNNWLKLLKALNIQVSDDYKIKKKKTMYNPFGSEGSPEHRNVKKYIIEKHYLLGYSGKTEAIEEYPLRSGDKIDVVYQDGNTIYAFEAKSIRSDKDDLERGVFQCVKYKKVIEAEIKVGVRDITKVVCSLVTETKLPPQLQKYCEQLGIKHYLVKVNI